MFTSTESPIVFAQIGDLHLTEAGGQNFKDFCSVLTQLETECPNLDFVYLPGDNADQGIPEQYKLFSTAIKMLSKPVYIISGDHDMEQKSLRNFYEGIAAAPLPQEIRIRQLACFFLDCCGPGAGGPDFRLGIPQLKWLEDGLKKAQQSGLQKAVFMHTYPEDLVDPEERRMITSWLDLYTVNLVAMGHTHYNEVGNDGTTVFCATRSTGQIVEGPVGYSLIALDGEMVSWRFKQLEDPFPFVLITSPADFRLEREGSNGRRADPFVRAKVFGQYQPESVSVQINSEAWQPLFFNNYTACWENIASIPFEGEVVITVRAIDLRNRPGFHQIRLSAPETVRPQRVKQGSDKDRIPFWPENGIPGTQLGPNRNAGHFQNTFIHDNPALAGLADLSFLHPWNFIPAISLAGSRMGGHRCADVADFPAHHTG